MADKSSREKVAELHAKNKSAKEIAEALDMSQANVYAHLRKISAEAGEAPRKRGRPPKVHTEGDAPKAEKTESKPATRPAPGAKASGTKPAPVKADTNGHDAGEYPNLIAALDKDLAAARRTVAKLEKMREALVG